MSQFQITQRIIAEHLIPEARKSQTAMFPMDETLPIALELFYTAMAIKAAHQHGARFIARRYAERMGLPAEQVETFAERRLAEILRDAE